MKSLPFRRRITLSATLLAAGVLLVAGLATTWIVYQRAISLLDDELRGESDHFFTELARHGGDRFDWKRVDSELHEWMPAENPPRLMEIRTDDGIVRFRSRALAAPGFEHQLPGLRTMALPGDQIRVLVKNQIGVTFSVAGSLREATSLVDGVLRALAVSFPISLAFAWFGSSWLARRAVEPVVHIATAAERVTAERLALRVPVPPVTDEMQRLALVLNAAFDRLERSYAQALRFSADASHELKTPLTVLRVSIEALLDSPSLTDNDRAAVAGLLEQTRRLTNITSSLLLLARADAGRLPLDRSEHDLSALTEACAEDARIIAEERGVRVNCELPPAAPAQVDAMRFSQIASNLLANAVKYNHPGGQVYVSLADAGPAWRLAVANTGEGIPPEHRARLFERFYRAEHTAEQSGQGLGLSLARELARAHGGEIALTRSDGEWTEFTVTLPKQYHAQRNGAH